MHMWEVGARRGVWFASEDAGFVKSGSSGAQPLQNILLFPAGDAS